MGAGRGEDEDEKSGAQGQEEGQQGGKNSSYVFVFFSDYVSRTLGKQKCKEK